MSVSQHGSRAWFEIPETVCCKISSHRLIVHAVVTVLTMEHITRIDKLEGHCNWSQWRFQICNMLRTQVHDGHSALGVINGTVEPPTPPAADAGEAAVSSYNDAMVKYDKLDAIAVTIMTTAMTRDICSMVMMLKSAKEIWNKLLSIYEQKSGQRLDFLICQLFNYRKDPADTIAQHVAKLEVLWTELSQEVLAIEHVQLPLSFLLNRILNTLPNDYFEFKSVWESRPHEQRTVKALTEELCLLEQRLKQRDGHTAESTSTNIALVAKQDSTRTSIRTTAGTSNKKGKKVFDKKKVRCFNCNLYGHYASECTSKWRANGSRNGNDTKTTVANVVDGAYGFTTEAFVHNVEDDRQIWRADNGATDHMTFDDSLFASYTSFDEPKPVRVGNNAVILAYGYGSINVEMFVNGKSIPSVLTNVWYVPELGVNLFSLIIAEMQGYSICAENGQIQLTRNGVIAAVGVRQGKSLYKMMMHVVKPHNASKVCLASAATPKSEQLQFWHERLCHQSKKHVQEFLRREGVSVNPSDYFCEACEYGKSHRQPFHNRTCRATRPGEIIHADVCGPMEESSLSGMRYFVCFKDDYSKYRRVYFMVLKSEVVDNLKEFLAEVAVAGHSVKVLMTDNGTEFDNAAVRKLLNGIEHRRSMPHTPEQNGSAERENRTLLEAARSMLAAKELPKKLWAEATLTASYVLNRTANSSVEEKTPYELWYGRKGAVDHLRIFGTECFVHIPKVKRKKWDAKSFKGVMIGYSGEKDGYRVWVPGTNNVYQSHDVRFKDEEIVTSKNEFVTLSRKSQEDKSVGTDTNHDNVTDADVPMSAGEPSPEVQSGAASCREASRLRDRTTLKKPARLEGCVTAATSGEAFTVITGEPTTYREAMLSQESSKWQEAMNEEMSSLEENNVWKLVQLPPDRKAIDNRWVFRIKQSTDGSGDRYKARLVAKGYSQRVGIDYDETFSPVVRFDTVRSVLSVAATENMYLAQFDVKTAFLYGTLEEEIYMRQPEGFDDGTNRVCKLERSLYGLKQSPRCWNKRFVDYLLELGFVKSDADPCLYVRKYNGHKLIIALYVDDGIVAASHTDDCRKFLADLTAEFKITAGPVSSFLGIEVKQYDDGSVFITQERYAEKVLEKFRMLESIPVGTPTVHEEDPKESVTKQYVGDNVPYRAAVGSLMYLATGTRPDIAYAVSVVSQKLDIATVEDWNKVKRILKYLKGTANSGILFQNQGPRRIEAFSDADYAQDVETRRSTSGAVCKFAGGAVTWLSQKQKCIALSTTEAEIIAANEAAKDVIWLKRLFSDLTDLVDLPVLRCDNIGAVKLGKNPEFHKRSKHIDTRYLWIRERYISGDLKLEHVAGDNQAADILTKPVPKPKFQRLKKLMGLVEQE